jgi:Ca2+-binding RTX toxin-like protein
MMVDYVSGSAADDDLTATPTGSILAGNGGADILRGGKSDDILVGGAGDDRLYGGAGADQFRFFGNQVGGTTDTDAIYDLNFSQGDTLVFGEYNGLFSTDAPGLDGFSSGNSAIISTFAGLAAAYEASGGRITYSGNPNVDLLVLSFDTGNGTTQNIRISNGYAAFVAEL